MTDLHDSTSDGPSTFQELASSRRKWIDEVLQPWCRSANRRDLVMAAAEWTDIAGKVDPDATLWTWAWARFPNLVYEGLDGVNETNLVRVRLNDGTEVVGFPDGQKSINGRLVLVAGDEGATSDGSVGPFSIDEIATVDVASAE